VEDRQAVMILQGIAFLVLAIFLITLMRQNSDLIREKDLLRGEVHDLRRRNEALRAENARIELEAWTQEGVWNPDE
jgi:FtsZ-binding cell division protein ZapB